MSKESLEHLFSLMDGEMSRDSGLFLTRRLASDEGLCDAWERYHLIRDCIRQPGSQHFVTGMSDKLNASLDAEQVHSVSLWQKSQWLKPVTGLAIAASVALMAIVVTAPQPGTTPGVSGEEAFSGTANQSFVSPNILPLSPVSQPASFAPAGKAQADRLNAYLVRHNQMAGTAGRQGFVSFVPIVATQSPVGTEVSDNKQKLAESTVAEQEATTNK